MTNPPRRDKGKGRRLSRQREGLGRRARVMVIRKQSDLEDMCLTGLARRQKGRRLETCTLAKMEKLDLRPA